MIFVSSIDGVSHSPLEDILVLKKEHKLLLLSGDRIVKAYSVALGSGGLAPKRRQGDDKTPEGFYRIDVGVRWRVREGITRLTNRSAIPILAQCNSHIGAEQLLFVGR